jgi:energy-coupling factor transporter transmembrane protein EcfT
MIGEKYLRVVQTDGAGERSIGTLGYLAILVWSFSLILLLPARLTIVALGLCALVALVLYPPIFRRLLCWRWLLLFVSLIVVNALWAGKPEYQALGFVPISLSGLTAGLQMTMRAVAILLAVDGFSSSVGISEIAGLVERVGLHGLGFSLGIAFNLLPCLRQSCANAWRTLRMRGGLRRERWLGLKLFFVTVLANALQRAEEIALAAESRAFIPEKAGAMPLKSGKYDALIISLAVVTALGVVFII